MAAGARINLETEFVAGDAGAKAISAGRPAAPGAFLAGRVDRHSIDKLGSKLRILTEVFGSSQPPPREESLADFVQRKFGAEVLDYLVTLSFPRNFLGMQTRWDGKRFSGPGGMGAKSRNLVRGRFGRVRQSDERERKPIFAICRKQTQARYIASHRRAPSLGSFRSGWRHFQKGLPRNWRENCYSTAIACVEAIQKMETVRQRLLANLFVEH